MIAELLPPKVATAHRFDDPPEATLYPAEAAVVAGAVQKRRSEFTTARLCAREALAQLGEGPVPLLPGERGAPSWPAGIVGSMTHCTGYRAAAVARAADVYSIGIDAEPHGPLPDGVLKSVSDATEREHLDALAAIDPGRHWDRLLFSAKESVYKAWYPLARRWLGFEEARLEIDPAGTFTARLLVPGPQLPEGELTSLAGHWLVRQGLVVTAIALVPGRPGTPVLSSRTGGV